jgi:signal transduction histidine kinase
MPDYPVLAMADSQKTSRIVENLFSNIRKYAMNGTRAYVEVSDGTDECSIAFKNISSEALDVSSDELTQRFVRGDASRSSEGNGLGLSIAKSLCELQKGRLEISIDGDLFKATVILPKA